MFVFYDWPFQHMYSAKNVANIIFPFNSWLSFSDHVVFYGDVNFNFVDSNRGSNNSVILVFNRS